MIYISGENETIASIMKEGEFTGSLNEFTGKFLTLNPNLCPTFNQAIPPCTPLLLPGASEEKDLALCKETVYLIKSFDRSQRQTLRKMQEDSQDCAILVAMDDLMEGFQKYAQQFVDFYDSPMINTPWDTFNGSQPNSSLIDIFAGTATYGSRYMKNGPLIIQLDDLYDHMMKRDALNRELHLLKKTGRAMVNGQHAARLEREIAKHQKQITVLLPKRLDNIIGKYLVERFDFDELRKMRIGSFSKKMIRKGKLVMTNFNFLNRSGALRLGKIAKFFGRFGKWGNTLSTYLGPAVVAYDSVSSYRQRGKDAGARALVTGSAGIAAGMAVGSLFGGSTSALGGVIISSLTGEAALGGVLLICSPVVGWIICGAVGLLAAGYVVHEASEFVGYLWDHRGKISDQISSIYHSVETKILSIWESSEQHVHWLYHGESESQAALVRR